MKTKYILMSLGAAASMFLSACSHDDGITRSNNKSTFDFSYSVEGIGTESKTRATVDATAEEQTVNTIHLFFFEPDIDREGELVEVVTIDGPLTMGQTYTVQGDIITTADPYNVIAIANIEDNLYINSTISDWKSQWTGYSERIFSEQVLASISFCNRIEADWIPMSGSTTKAVNSGILDMTLSRVVARIDVQNTVSGYDLDHTSVWNAYYTSSLTGDGVLDYAKVLGSRTQKFYEGTPSQNACESQLYVFENQVIAPENGDRYTTCVILGLNNGTRTGYYRINVHPNGSAQYLKRNNAYRITITGVNGDGADNEEEAYLGTTTELDYTINYWDLDDNGLIVSDMYSILAIPTKTVRIGQDGTVGNTYTITTFSTLANPNPLSIKSQIYDPADGNIQAYLSGNTLTITASALPNGDPDRSGIITLTYADLEASINVYQSASVDKYLTITLEDGFSNVLPASGLASSENIYVSASGSWTTTLYDAYTPNAFTLRTDKGIPVDELKYTDWNLNRFRISTWSTNDGPEKEERRGFVLVSLDDDPLNYVSVIAVTQRVASEINLVPDISEMRFDGVGNVTYPSGGTGTVRINAGGAINAISISGADANKFSVDYSSINLGVDQTGTFTISTTDTNYTGTSYNAALTIVDGAAGTATINLTQTSLGLTLSPNNISNPVSAKGGYTEWITVSMGSATSLTYKAELTNYGNVFNHEAHIELENGTTGQNLTNVPISQRFRIVFPKVYYPNRDQDIWATVKVTVADLDESITASQYQLNSQGLKVWSSSGSHYGALNSSVATTYYGPHNTFFFSYAPSIAGTSGYTFAQGPTGTGNSSNIPSSPTTYSYVHICNLGLTAAYNWTNVKTFMSSVDGHTVFMCDADGTGPVNAINNSPMAEVGYRFAEATNSVGYPNSSTQYASRINTAAAATRVYQILLDRGITPISGSSVGLFYKDGVATTATTVPSTGVQIVSYHNGTPSLVVDPTNRFIYNGDCTIFYSDTYINQGNNVRTFMHNYIDYVCRTAMYGSHFTDLLIDWDASDPNYLPAPWDDEWGSNKWPN